MPTLDSMSEVAEAEALEPRIEDLEIGSKVEIVKVIGRDKTAAGYDRVRILEKTRGEMITMATAIMRTLGGVETAQKAGKVSESDPAVGYLSTYPGKGGKTGKKLVGKESDVVRP